MNFPFLGGESQLTRQTTATYAESMSTGELIEKLLALPLPERVNLAEALWESIDASGRAEGTDAAQDAIALARRRDAELTSGAVVARTHEEVMEAVRRELGCE